MTAISYWIRGNDYPGSCAICGEHVDRRAGWCQKSRETGKWETICNGCVWEHARFIPVKTAGGQNLYARDIANGSMGSCPIGHCTGCHKLVGLVKSKRGKWYFANTYPAFNESGAPRVYGFDAHECPGRGDEEE